jgi:hypothetical protein
MVDGSHDRCTRKWKEGAKGHMCLERDDNWVGRCGRASRAMQGWTVPRVRYGRYQLRRWSKTNSAHSVDQPAVPDTLRSGSVTPGLRLEAAAGGGRSCGHRLQALTSAPLLFETIGLARGTTTLQFVPGRDRCPLSSPPAPLTCMLAMPVARRGPLQPPGQ